MSRRRSAHYRNIDFDRELAIGGRAYDRIVGDWWRRRSLDAAHAHAYRKIARLLRSSMRRSPRLIIDYGCGSGSLMARLYRTFPRSRFIGIDGSEGMLRLARRRVDRLGDRSRGMARFIHSELPDFTLPRGIADAIVYAFPHIVPAPDGDPQHGGKGRVLREDSAAARWLAAAREPDPGDEAVTEDAETLYESLMAGRAISRNMRGLLKRGGVWVMEDVYHQTKDRSDRKGGYFVSVLEAI